MTKGPNYVTNQELKSAFDRYDTINRKYRDQILSGLDDVMKELETMREESTLGVYQTREIKEEVDDHEKRIKSLETT